MPVSDPLLDPVFAELVDELRDARTPAPETLIARVDRLVTEAAPAPRRRRLRVPLPPRRVVLGVAGACAVVAAGIAVSRVPTESQETAFPASAPAGSVALDAGAVGATTAAAAAVEEDGAAADDVPKSAERQTSAEPAPATNVPTTGDAGRLQHQDARLTIALRSADDVADATGQVTRAVTGYGGHIVTVQFATPEGREARSEIVAKVPVQRMEEATSRFTALGRLAGAQVDISDLQARADSLEQRVATARLQIARLTAQLAADDLTTLQRATLEERRAAARKRLADLNASVRRTQQEAAFADLTVVLVTDPDLAVAAPVDDDGPGATVRDALGVLAGVGVVALYAAIVAAPIVLLVALVLGSRRWLRRRRERHLLETA